MPKVHPTEAKKAVQTLATFLVGAFEALEAMEQGDHPIQAVTKAYKKAKKRAKNKKLGKKALRKSKETIDV